MVCCWSGALDVVRNRSVQISDQAVEVSRGRKTVRIEDKPAIVVVMKLKSKLVKGSNRIEVKHAQSNVAICGQGATVYFRISRY